MKHPWVERTSPTGKGSKFVGTCMSCGATGLTFGTMGGECPNPRGLTNEAALLEAMQHETKTEA